MFRLRSYTRGGALTDFILLCVFVILLYVFLVRRGYMGQVDSAIDHHNKHAHAHNHETIVIPRADLAAPKANVANPQTVTSTEETSLLLIDSRLKRILDVRSKECASKTYSLESKVAVIIDYSDYQFYDVKTLVSSILLNSDKTILRELILVDDGTSLDYVIKASKEFVQKFGPTVKLIRNEKKRGSVKSRQRAAESAVSSILLFVDINNIVNVGWLEPLVDILEHRNDVIALPHFDIISDPVSYEYIRTEDGLRTTFTWSLTTRMIATPTTSPTKSIETAVMRGNTFAITAKYLKSLGGLDELLTDSLSQSMELSFRTWLCGGKLVIAPCSRVGVLNLHDPVRVSNSNDVRRVAELWMGSKKPVVYKSTGVEAASSNQILSAQRRLKELSHLQCKDFDWYLANVAKSIMTPSARSRYHGVLRSKTGRCASIGKDFRVDLGSCKAQKFTEHGQNMVFEIDEDGFITTMNGKCLAAQEGMYVMSVDCVRTDNRHQWTYSSRDKILTNKNLNLCAMHVTDPDKNHPGRQIMMTQDCGFDNSKDKQFIKWEFVPL